VEQPKKIPLASGLIGHKAGSTNGQLEVSLVNYDTIHIAFWRKTFCNLPDIEFSISQTDLQDIIDTLNEANKKADDYYLSLSLARARKTMEAINKDST